MPKVLIVDDVHPVLISKLESKGFDVEYLPEITHDELGSKLSDIEGIVIRSKTNLDRAILAQGSNLKFIARAGAGIEKIDLTYASEKGIVILNAPEGNRDAVAEHTLGMLLSVMNHQFRAHRQIDGGVWKREENRGHELNTRTVGILGFGYMGQALAKRLIGFGCQVIAYDKFKKKLITSDAESVDLDEFKKRTNILSIHLPLTPETKGWINSSFLHEMPNLEYLVNTARGEIVDLSAVTDLLASGKLKGACLDVLENEKLNQLTTQQKLTLKILTNHPNVIVTPHVAGWTYESYEKISVVLADKILQLYA